MQASCRFQKSAVCRCGKTNEQCFMFPQLLDCPTIRLDSWVAIAKNVMGMCIVQVDTCTMFFFPYKPSHLLSTKSFQCFCNEANVANTCNWHASCIFGQLVLQLSETNLWKHVVIMFFLCPSQIYNCCLHQRDFVQCGMRQTEGNQSSSIWWLQAYTSITTMWFLLPSSNSVVSPLWSTNDHKRLSVRTWRVCFLFVKCLLWDLILLVRHATWRSLCAWCSHLQISH